MDLFIIGLIFIFIGILSTRMKHRFLSPVTLFIYGGTLLVVFFVEQSSLPILATIRYYFYLTSGFIIGFLPLLLILIFIILLLKSRFWKQKLTASMIFDSLTTLFLLGMTLFIIWAMLNFELEMWEKLIESLVNMTIYFLGIFFMYFLLMLVLQNWPKSNSSKYIGILGVAIEKKDRVPKILKSRVDCALKYYKKLKPNEQNSINFILSGGANQQSIKTEAQVMKELLMERSISSDQIIEEDTSYSTKQNLENIHALLKGKLLTGPMMIVTSDFHLVRTFLLAWQEGLSIYLKGARTPFWLFPYYFVRDLLAFIVMTKRLFILSLIYLLLRSFIFTS